MLLSERIVCVGVGQCGGNMVKELENLGFNAFYINTSLEDLLTINTSQKNKYHIKNTKGMAKNQEMARECVLKDNVADNICYAINDQYAMSDIIFFFYSMAGGTGGGISVLLAENMKDIFPEKTINVISVIPKSTEDIGLQANAINSLQLLKESHEAGHITQVHLLNNNKRDNIFDINKDFSICFDRFINFSEVNKEGNLDEEEKEKMLLEYGMGVILEFSNEDFGNGLASALDSSIYTNWLKNPSLHALILNKKQNKEVNKELIKDALGMPVYTHQSIWDEDSNVIFSVGMGFNDNILSEMKKKAQEMLDKKKKIEEATKQNKIEDVDFDASIITSKTNKTINHKSFEESNNNNCMRRRRGEKRASSILDKYRNM